MCKTESSKLPRNAMALSKVSLGAKQVSYIRESVKAIVEKLVETSVDNALDKKAEWTKQIKDVEDAELKQAMNNTLGNTKGKTRAQNLYARRAEH